MVENDDETKTKKRKLLESSDEPPTSSQPSTTARAAPLQHIPLTSHYHVSFMHANVVTAVACSHKHGFVMTGSRDGTVKFWKRLPVAATSEETKKNKDSSSPDATPCLEFVKSFTAHEGSVLCLELDPSHDTCCSLGTTDSWLKIFDVSTFDVMLIQSLPDAVAGNVTCCEWLVAAQAGQVSALAVATRSGSIHVFSTTADSNTAQCLQTLSIHGTNAVSAMAYNAAHDCMISCDVKGIVEVWDCSGSGGSSGGETRLSDLNDDDPTEETVASLNVGGPCTRAANGIQYESKLDTDLYSLMRKKTYAIAIAVAADKFVIYGADQKIRVFDHATGKILVTYDERLKVYDKSFSQAPYDLDAMEYGKRAATEREIAQESTVFTTTAATTAAASSSTVAPQRLTIQLDASGRYLMVPTCVGIKVMDTQRHKLVGILGQADASQVRFVSVCSAPGDAKVDRQMQLARSSAAKSRNLHGTVKATAKSEQDDAPVVPSDALVVALAYQQRRFYVFSHVDPVVAGESDKEALSRRDVWNEAPTAQDQLLSNKQESQEKRLASKAILRTSMGDITIQLLPSQVPRTIENFCGHARSGYYDGVIFHRIIKSFMLQTGDPLGDGTGGESIWGGEFEDEFVSTLRHDRPFTVSMANAGPNTNGSQFFITTVPTPWLDNKHTVFGRVIKGMDVCTLIENVKVDDLDKPLDEVRIISVDLE